MSIISKISHDKYEHIDVATGLKWKDQFALFRKKHGFRYSYGRESEDMYYHSWKDPSGILLEAKYFRENNKTTHVKIVCNYKSIPSWYNELIQLLHQATADVNVIDEASMSEPAFTPEDDIIKHRINMFLYDVGIDPDTYEQFKPVQYGSFFIKRMINMIKEKQVLNPKKCIID